MLRWCSPVARWGRLVLNPKLLVFVWIKNYESIRFQRQDYRKVLGADWQYKALERPYTYVTADVVIDGVKFSNVGVRKKGFVGSQSSDRPSLKIKLDYTNKKAEIDGLSLLTLNNNRQDKSLQSQYTGYSFFERAGSPAPRCAYAQVTVNGTNLGIYSHVESARKPLVSRGFRTGEGMLYEGQIVDFYLDWKLAFDKKFGKEKSGLAKIRSVIDVLQETNGDVKQQEYFVKGQSKKSDVPTVEVLSSLIFAANDETTRPILNRFWRNSILCVRISMQTPLSPSSNLLDLLPTTGGSLNVISWLLRSGEKEKISC